MNKLPLENILNTRGFFGFCVYFFLVGALVAGNAFAQSETTWHSPRSGWALQKLEWAKRTQPSTAWRTVVADGKGVAPLISWPTLVETDFWSRAGWRLSRDWNGVGGFGGMVERGDAEAGLLLPTLPDGAWWLMLKVFDDEGRLLKAERHFINVWNSSVQAEPEGNAEALGRLAVTFENGVLTASARDVGEMRIADLGVEVQVREFDGRVLAKRPLSPVSSGGESPGWSAPIPEATPGKTLRLIVVLKQGERVIDGDELWVATPGASSPTPEWAPVEGVRALRDIFSGETVSSFLPLESQRSGLDIQLAGLRERGGGAVQLWIQWGRIETIPGAYDWDNLDAYVAYLTEKQIPFTLASAGSVLFGNGPLHTWSDWMLNHEGEFKLWRKIPVISPASLSWRESARDFTRRLVERYRGNPWLRGYTFIGQGMDSGIFTDHYDSVTDYGPAARADFGRFLREKYPALADINAAWGTDYAAWSEVRMPMPRFETEVNLTVPWIDFTQWKLAAYRASTIDVFDPVIAELDPRRTVFHYLVKTGPFEHLLKGTKVASWGGADGAGEDYRMGRINAITHNWGLLRQTESHDVPPANLRYMMDMVSQTLRGEAEHVRFNLVWNTQASQFEKNYPANTALQETVRWWSDTAPLRQRLAAAHPAPAELGVVLSWSDMLYRLRAWRWYAMPGNRADRLVRASGFQPVRWLSEWAPDSAWNGLGTVLVPDDALVWDDALLKQIQRHVAGGGRLVVWGRAGQYSLAGGDGSNAAPFTWAGKLGAVGLQANVSTKLAAKGVEVTVDTKSSATNLTITRNDAGRPKVVAWPYGKGTVQWCLAEDAESSDALVAKVLSEGGVPTRVSSSTPEVEGVLRKDGDRYLLVLSRYMGYGKKPDPVPLAARIGLPGLAGEWTVKRLLPAAESDPAEVPTWDAFRGGSAKVALSTSEMQVFELTPATGGAATGDGEQSDDPVARLRFAPAPRVLRDLSTPLPDSEGAIPDGVSVRQVVFESCSVATPDGPVTNEVYAVIARPSATGPHPGLLLLHGGMGRCETKRALLWAKRGYVVVALDIPGIADPKKVSNSVGAWTKHPYQHDRWRVKPVLEDSMMYQSVAAAVQAFRLLSVQPDVDSTRLGVHGISWGGYMTAMVSSIMGPEVTAAFSIYGAGYYEECRYVADLNKLPAAERADWINYFDAERRADKIVAPYFIAAASNDFAFWPPAVEKTLAGISGDRNQVFAPNANHKLPIPGGSTKDIWADMAEPYFGYHLMARGDPLPRVSWNRDTDDSRRLRFSVNSSRPVVSAGVHYSDASVHWTKRQWKRVEATKITDGCYVADIPADAGKDIDYYALVSDDRPVSVSTLMQRIR